MRAWLSLSRDELVKATPSDITARLTAAQAFQFPTIEPSSLLAWEEEAKILQTALLSSNFEGSRVLFEYDLLRLDKRLDAVIVTSRVIIVLEFKFRARAYALQDQRQADDYAQDLLDFHSGCRGKPVLPVLVCTDAPNEQLVLPLIGQGPLPLLCCNARNLPAVLNDIFDLIEPTDASIDVNAWEQAAYRPVPSIIAAASLLYAKHGVAHISKARSDAYNLTLTTEAIRRIIAETRAAGTRSVVFVTGIPGAGKTLCGLNIAFQDDDAAAFLSGNVPLVKVLREALARNAADRNGTRREFERHKTHGVLQNVHRFLEECVTSGNAPPESVIIFDEAQRAWNAEQATKDTQRRKSHLRMSEPAHALEIMDRAEGYAVIVALVGQGQEINTGEAGLAEWGRAIAETKRWRGFASPTVLNAAAPEQRLPKAPWLTLEDELNLSVPIRAVRSDAGAAWVEAVLRNDIAEAAHIAKNTPDLPYFLTRNLDSLRANLRRFCRGNRRAGLIASSGAKRLRAEGLGVQTTSIEDWFLNSWPDVRASEALETYATEYDCQGLELDVVGLAWGGDLCRQDGNWVMKDFVGTRWNRVAKADTRSFINNTYRVLLTRARYETVIWVPPGSRPGEAFYDSTRDAITMDVIAECLSECGLKHLP
jgi:hypothetical protein